VLSSLNSFSTATPSPRYSNSRWVLSLCFLPTAQNLFVSQLISLPPFYFCRSSASVRSLLFSTLTLVLSRSRHPFSVDQRVDEQRLVCKRRMGELRSRES
jgi:hypothetical protein